MTTKNSTYNLSDDAREFSITCCLIRGIVVDLPVGEAPFPFRIKSVQGGCETGTFTYGVLSYEQLDGYPVYNPDPIKNTGALFAGGTYDLNYIVSDGGFTVAEGDYIAVRILSCDLANTTNITVQLYCERDEIGLL